MIECNSTSKMVYQQLREDQCCEPRDKRENGHASILNRWLRILRNILTYTEANAHKYDRYQPVPLGGGSIMFIRYEPESIFREGKRP